MSYTIEPIAHIYNNYNNKFGIPRQSGLENESVSEIVFCEKYRDDNALRGLDGYSHIWLLWIFTEAETSKEWSPTVRPPRLGGNKRMGVFSTRSPFHPNRIGLSCVKIKTIEKTKDKGTVIKVTGADILSGTPLVDIKPYLAFTDSHPEALGGFSDNVLEKKLKVEFDTDVSKLSEASLAAITTMLAQDPRPSYQNDNKRIYSMNYSNYNINFFVNNDTLTVTKISQTQNGSEK